MEHMRGWDAVPYRGGRELPLLRDEAPDTVPLQARPLRDVPLPVRRRRRWDGDLFQPTHRPLSYHMEANAIASTSYLPSPDMNIASGAHGSLLPGQPSRSSSRYPRYTMPTYAQFHQHLDAVRSSTAEQQAPASPESPDMADASLLSNRSLPYHCPVRAIPPQSDFTFGINHTARHVLPTPLQHEHSLQYVQPSEEVELSLERATHHQRRKQEEMRLAASGGMMFPDSDDEAPPTKKRRSMTGAIVTGALHAAMFTGAAALTAYSIWSSWGKKEEQEEVEEEDGFEQRRLTSSSSRKAIESSGGLEEPPPPYTVAGPVKAIMAPPSVPTASPASTSARPVHVFVSSRRRRTVFPIRRRMQSSSAGRTTVPNTAQPSPVKAADAAEPVGEQNEEEDEDAMFQRFQDRMSSLIEEGKRALDAKADLSGMDVEDDMDISASSHARIPSRLPRPVPVTPPRRAWRNTVHDPLGEQSFDAAGSHRLPRRTGSPASSTPPSQLPILSLARRDPDSPYKRLSRPSSTFSSPVRR